jgi:myosin regulatory light chain 12
MFASLGKEVTDQFIEDMLDEAPGGAAINFTMFLSMFGEKMSNTDPEDVWILCISVLS